MGQSYRIKTEIGINKTINVKLEQDYEFLEILSLKLQQEDIYLRSCADYGVLVGRVTANNGLGIPNARISIFIPIERVDESNPIVTSIYPYKSPSDKNEDGYRYNLLSYEKSYSSHAATGTVPSRTDALTDLVATEIYDKYYKFTAKTNESGDYMIMGIPVGYQTVVMDVDLSDIGEFSLTPQDLIRMGLATEAQVAGNRFKTSTDLNSLPQIKTITKSITISPLWGEQDICQIAINRVDFDLRDDANVDIQPTATFMGALYSSPDSFRIRGPRKVFFNAFTASGCKPKDNLGNLCDLQSGPGQILAIRQTINQGSDGNPILEEYVLEQSGNIIDGDGVWLTELPMNLDYIFTNEFGEKALSNDPKIGVPTKSKYRFKIKWQQPPTLTEQVRRAYYLVPNIKEYGWRGTSQNDDPNYDKNISANQKKQLGSSYYFGLAWSGYTDGFTTQSEKLNRTNEIINCEDTFYQFTFNKVYTVAGLIDQYKKGAKGRFIGIKEIDSNDCSSTVNKFPVNDGFRNFDFLFFIFSLLMTIITPLALCILIIAHILLFIYNLVIRFLCALCRIRIFRIRPFAWICRALGIKCETKDFTIRLPMITYPDCEACTDCKQDIKSQRVIPDVPEQSATGFLSYFSAPDFYLDKLEGVVFSGYGENVEAFSKIYSQAVAGNSGIPFINNSNAYKLPVSDIVPLADGRPMFATSDTLPLGERINIFNQRTNYFTGKNKIKVTFAKNSNVNKFHYDNTLTVVANEIFEPGTLLSFVNVTNTQDKNFLYSATTTEGIITGISGTSYIVTGQTGINVRYATSQTGDQSVNYKLPYQNNDDNYRFPKDIEYYQVITAMTMSQFLKTIPQKTITITSTFGTNIISATTIVPDVPVNSFPSMLLEPMIGQTWIGYPDFAPGAQGLIWYNDSVGNNSNNTIYPSQTFTDWDIQYILILQRGVDPYSPLYINEFNVGPIFGSNLNDTKYTFTASTRVNIPIQKLETTQTSIQEFSETQMFYNSYFFNPIGLQYSAFTSEKMYYYGYLDAQTPNFNYGNVLPNKNVVTKTNNRFYSPVSTTTKYDLSEDVSGMGIMTFNNKNVYFTTPRENYSIQNELFVYYYSEIASNIIQNPISLSTSNRNVMRTDRLPSSDFFDGNALLQQNLKFTIYPIDTSSEDISSPSYSTGAEQVQPDLGGLAGATQVLESFNCESMVGLDCYEGFGTVFRVNPNCEANDGVQNGCYLFMRKPLVDLGKDLRNFSEYSFRFKFFYGLCRGVLSQSFMNNWVNGSLYAFPIQVDTFYDNKNKPFSKYCQDLIYFDKNTTNLYYRSSPYQLSINQFIGKEAVQKWPFNSVNDRNLLYPTTIVNLGAKDSFYQEISFDASYRGYLINQLDSTSYSDMSDLVNLFVISRITDEGFIRQIFSFGDNSLNQLFSRNNKNILNNARRIDGDLAQLMSINSEVGLNKFSPEFYETDGVTLGPTTILGTPTNPAVAVWFSSDVNQLQLRDFISPGRINFRPSNISNYLPYPYELKSQTVPFYQWETKGSGTIFGGQESSWKTETRDIVTKPYQSLDRTNRTVPTYFQSTLSPQNNDLFQYGYISSLNVCISGTTNGAFDYVDFSGKTQVGNSIGEVVEYSIAEPNEGIIPIPNSDTRIAYLTTGTDSNVFMVGAPYHFYFGTVKGKSALDMFKTKYAISEDTLTL